MSRIRSNARPIGMGAGLLFVIAGIATTNFGLAGFGVVVALAGFFAHKDADPR